MDLLERASFLDALAEYAAQARSGDGRMVLVSGESGIGKTALLEAFQRRGRGARWLWGACDGLLTPRPLGPLFDIGPQAGGELAELCRREAPREQLFAAGPYALALAGGFRGAAGAWERLGCRYEAALALFDAQEETSLREALRRFDGLGASAGRTWRAGRCAPWASGASRPGPAPLPARIRSG